MCTSSPANATCSIKCNSCELWCCWRAGCVLTVTCVAACLAWLWSWVLPRRWLPLLPGRLLRAAVLTTFTGASISPTRGFLARMGPLPDLPEEFSALKAPGAMLAYKGGPQFWLAAAYPLATLLVHGHTWLLLLLVASCCGGWWAALLAQGSSMAGGGAGSFLWALVSHLPSASQVLIEPWLHGVVVKVRAVAGTSPAGGLH